MKRMLLFLSLSFFMTTALRAAETVEVWKDPNCGCCTAWLEHLQASGFSVRPKAAGIAVPGMPAGSPGIKAPASKPYESLLFTREGATRVWQVHLPNDHLPRGKSK